MQGTGLIKVTNLQPQCTVHHRHRLPLPCQASWEIVKMQGQTQPRALLDHTRRQDNTETQRASQGSVTTVMIRLMGFPTEQQL